MQHYSFNTLCLAKQVERKKRKTDQKEGNFTWRIAFAELIVLISTAACMHGEKGGGGKGRWAAVGKLLYIMCESKPRRCCRHQISRLVSYGSLSTPSSSGRGPLGPTEGLLFPGFDFSSSSTRISPLWGFFNSNFFSFTFETLKVPS